MGQAAVSWLLPFLPMLDMGSSSAELRRAGNEHRQFVPANYHPTQDGFVLVAVGSDVQWQRLVREPMFSSLARKELLTSDDPEVRAAAVGGMAGQRMHPWPWPMPRPRPFPE